MYADRMDDRVSLWTRSRHAAYAEISGVAMKLFLAQGFEQTTIEEIAATAGISRRSFFRYFGTKEDIVLGGLADQGVLARDILEAIPLSVAPWEALRVTLRRFDEQMQEPGNALKISKMMYETPSLRARSIEKHLRWQELLVPNIRTRLGIALDDLTDPGPDAIVASAISCLDVAGQLWTRTNGTEDLSELYDRAVRAVRHVDR